MNAIVCDWKQYICRACGVIYDEEAGDPDSGLAPGTRFADIPDDWECPLCGVQKCDFAPYEPAAVSNAESTAVVSHEKGVVIVGGGTAGWAVAEALRALDTDLPITLVSQVGAFSCRTPRKLGESRCPGSRFAHGPLMLNSISCGLAYSAFQ